MDRDKEQGTARPAGGKENGLEKVSDPVPNQALGKNLGEQPHEFDTLEEAKSFYEKQPIKCDVRIVEAYVQVRYKPVREDLYK